MGFHHEALFYTGPRELATHTAAFAREGLAGGDRVLIMLTSDKLDAVRDELGSDAPRVTLADMAKAGRNPGRIISAWHDFAMQSGSRGDGLRGVGEPIWAGRSDPEVFECQRHEELLNLVFAGTSGFQLICPYDVEALDPALVDAALCSHPTFQLNGVAKPSPAYRPEVHDHEGPLTPPPPDAHELVFTIDALHGVRLQVSDFAADAGLREERIEDLVLAVNEVAGNSVRHGGGVGTLRMWIEDDTVVAEVRDRGRIHGPLAGRLRPTDGPAVGGHGLWLTNQVCDLVQVRSDVNGTVVRLHVALDANRLR